VPGSIFIPIISAFDAKGVTQAKGAITGLAAVVKNLKGAAIAAAAAYATIGLTSFIKEATASARDFEAANIGLTSMFGDSSAGLKQFAKQTSALGLSQLEASRNITFLGSSLMGNGLIMDDSIEKTKVLIAIGADLAATYGKDISESVTALATVFRGEYDPIEKFGVAIKQQQVNALLAERGQAKLTGSMKAAAQAVARYDLILQATAKAQGNLAKMQDTLFVKQNQLNASFENMKAIVGKALNKPLADLLGSLIPIVDQVGGKLVPMFMNFAKVVKMLTPLVKPLADVSFVLQKVFGNFTGVLIALIEPLIVPLISAVKLLATTFQVLEPILKIVTAGMKLMVIPLTIIGYTLDFATKGTDMLIGSLSKIPGVSQGLSAVTDFLNTITFGFVKANEASFTVVNTTKDIIESISKPQKLTLTEALNAQFEQSTATINKTKDAISSLIDDARNTQKSLMGAFDITKILDSNQDAIVESVTYIDGKFRTVISGVTKGSQDLVSKFAANLTKLKTFYTNLNKLTENGLSPELRQQLISAGPDAGNATAEAILASGKEGIKGLNKTFAGIKSLAGTIGVQSAKAMTSVGEKLGNGLIDGLVASRDKLIAEASQLGEDLAVAIKNSAAGHFTAAWSLAGTSTYVTPPGVNNTDKQFITRGNQIISPYTVDVPGVTRPYNFMTANQFSNPFAANETGFLAFQTAQNKANEYNIVVKVEPGAASKDIANTLIKTIQEYERKKGKIN